MKDVTENICKELVKVMSFEETIKMIREGFNEWRFHNEESVKQGIILPILQSLEWNIFDTREVYPQHYMPKDSKAKKADYVLYGIDTPILVIEAKTLNGYNRTENNVEENKKQALLYAENLSVRKLIVTDGLYWRLYTEKTEKEGLTINILNDDDTIHLEKLLNKNELLNKKNEILWNDIEEIEDKKSTLPQKSDLTLYDSFSGKSVYLKIIDNYERVIFNNEIINDNGSGYSWGRSYGKFCQNLYEHYSKEMTEFAKKYTYFGGKKENFSFDSSNSKDAKCWIPLKEKELYVNIAKSNNEHCTMIRELLKHFSIYSDKIVKLEQRRKYIKTITASDIEAKHLSLSKKQMKPLFNCREENFYIKDSVVVCDKNFCHINRNAGAFVINGLGLRNWYSNQSIKEGAKFYISFDEKDIYKGLGVIHIEPVIHD